MSITSNSIKDSPRPDKNEEPLAATPGLEADGLSEEIIAMNLAVKVYGVNPDGVPEAWPAEAVELGDSEVLPPGDYVLMTTEQYELYRADNRAEYDQWVESQQPPAQPPSYEVVMTPGEYAAYQAFLAGN